MRHVREVAASRARLIFDPSQQIPILTGEQLAEGIDLADIVVANDYEFSMIGRKADLSLDDIERRVDMLVITYGENGSEIRAGGERVHIPVAPLKEMVDPTGAGDAYRAGLVKGLLMGLDLDMVGRIAAQTATYPIERYGTQEQRYGLDEFVERFDVSFPEYAGRLRADDLVMTAAR
jgi:adenosine kinase